MNRLMIAVGVLLLAAGGCAHGPWASRRATGQHLDDYYQQQVLDNLAMFIEDSHAMPHVVASSASTQEPNAAVDAQSTAQNKNRISTSGNAHKQLALAPVSNPAKILGIRAEFQQAASLYTASRAPVNRVATEEQTDLHVVAAHDSPRTTSPVVRSASTASSMGKKAPEIELSSHQQILTAPQRGTASIPAPNYRQMYGIDRSVSRGMPDRATASNESASPATTVAVSPKCGCQKCVTKRNAAKQTAETAVTVVQRGETSKNNCWYAVGNPKEIPVNYDGKVGRYGKTCVWVPAKGHAEFQQLVTSVMDKAKTEQPATARAEVTTADQAKPTIASRSYRTVAATIPIAGDPLRETPRETPRMSPIGNRSNQEVQPTTVLLRQDSQEFLEENESLKFDRQLSLQALSDWNSIDTEETTGASKATKTAELEQRQLQTKRY